MIPQAACCIFRLTRRRRGALAAIREVVDTYRRLAQENPARFASALAQSLNNLSLRLGETGDGAGALAASRAYGCSIKYKEGA